MSKIAQIGNKSDGAECHKYSTIRLDLVNYKYLTILPIYLSTPAKRDFTIVHEQKRKKGRPPICTIFFITELLMSNYCSFSEPWRTIIV